MCLCHVSASRLSTGASDTFRARASMNATVISPVPWPADVGGVGGSGAMAPTSVQQPTTWGSIKQLYRP